MYIDFWNIRKGVNSNEKVLSLIDRQLPRACFFGLALIAKTESFTFFGDLIE